MGPFLLAAAAWVFFLIAISSVIALVYPLVRGSVARLHPGPRAVVLRAVAVAPMGLAAIAVALCYTPKLMGGLFSGVDHCFDHSDAHLHFCLNHPPHIPFGAGAKLALSSVAGAGLAAAALQVSRLRRSSRILRQLVSTSRFDADRRVWLIESEQPIALSVGLLRIRTLLSSGLLRMIPDRLVDAIVAHESAHERRRDGLWKTATALLSFGHLPGTRRRLVADLDLACEQACDEEAGRRLGDRTRVAEALLAMERIRHRMPDLAPAAIAFAGHDLPARVESLLAASPGHRPARRTLVVLLAVACGLMVLAANPLHHATETLIHALIG